MKVKNWNQFIIERLGVPDNIVDSATKLYQVIVDNLDSDDENTTFGSIMYFSQSTNPGNKLNIKKDLSLDFSISELKFSDVKFNITIHITDNISSIDVASWAVSVSHEDDSNYKVVYNKSNVGSIYLKVDFVVSPEDNFNGIKDYLLDRRSNTIGILTHELKHVYDKYMIGQYLLSDIIEYQSFAKTSTGFEELDNFFYYLYLTSQEENLVRSSEIAGQIISSGITKSEFKDFLEETKVYKQMIKIKNWSYEGLKNDLLLNIEDIRKMFHDIPESEPDEEVIDVVLRIAYNALMEKSSDIIEEFLDLNNAAKLLTGKIKKEDIDFYNEYLKSKSFKSYDDFFNYWEKKLKFEANKVIKKISKLYDMCKDENINPVMLKINDRIDGKCIVNPKLYREVVLGSKTKKIDYKKN